MLTNMYTNMFVVVMISGGPEDQRVTLITAQVSLSGHVSLVPGGMDP